ncbi:neuferricin-like [Dysidea avara]|uniref:neuferricin-like n=1 Tax=Dysidea avara TaxID=196820 RepID=UPI00332B0787
MGTATQIICALLLLGLAYYLPTHYIQDSKDGVHKKDKVEDGTSAGKADESLSFGPSRLRDGDNVRLLTKEELARHGPNGPDKPILLAVMGRVFDVEKGRDNYYGPNGGYNFFSGVDGTRAFVTGEFNEKGLIDDIRDLKPAEINELQVWIDFYDKEYTFYGKVIGAFYDKDGRPTEELTYFEEMKEKYVLFKKNEKAEQNQYPGCNSKWSEAEGGEVYCSSKSGGIHRDWVGFPRRLFSSVSREWRCSCVHPDNLGNPNLKEYPNCDPNSIRCQTKPPGKL